MGKRVNRDDIDKLHDYSLYIPTRTIYVGSETFDVDGNESGTDGLMAERLIKNIHILEHISGDPITIISNNLGGDIYHGFAMMDAILYSPCHITMEIRGHAMSMGSIILQVADKRIMCTNARQMIHYGYAGADGHARTFQKVAAEYAKIDKWIEKMYLKRIQEKNPAFTLEEVKKLLEHDTFYSATESVAMGLADEVKHLPKKGK
jgi:ATP-dependent protease ClpP protease subunit